MLADITWAIENKKLLCFHYTNLLRIVEPYALVLDDLDYHILVGYQIEGESLVGERGLREFKVKHIKDLMLTDRTFISDRKNYKMCLADKKMIMVEIES